MTFDAMSVDATCSRVGGAIAVSRPPTHRVGRLTKIHMAITGRERAELRAEAHHLDPLVHLGAQGITAALVQSLDDALRTRELVKVQLGRPTEERPRAVAERLAQETGAVVVQVIGRTATLYRENPDLERKDGAPPPWRR
jgi:RNA-binding protein